MAEEIALASTPVESVMDARQDLADRLITALYEGILEPRFWTTGLEAIAQITGSDCAALTIWDRTINQGSIHECAALPEECRLEYNAHFTWVDPVRTRIDGFAVRDWYIDQLHFGKSEIQRSEFYQDFLRKYDLESVMVCPLLRLNGVESFLSLERGLHYGLFDSVDQQTLRAVIPHLQRAIRIRSRLYLVARKAELAASALDSLQLPLLIVDEKGRVLMSNRHAEQLLGQRILRKTNGSQFTIPYADAAQLERHIKQACGRDGHASASAMCVVNQNSEIALQVIVLPLPAGSQLGIASDHPLALVVLHDPQMLRPTSQALLRQLYSLTPAEARLAGALLEGGTLQETAARLQLGLSTVRSQLKAVFRKTGVQRQADLIRLLSPTRTLGQAA